MNSEKFSGAGSILYAKEYYDFPTKKGKVLEVKILDEGIVVKSEKKGFSDQMLFTVNDQGISKRLYLSQVQVKQVEKDWGTETLEWIGKTLRMEAKEFINASTKAVYAAWELTPIESNPQPVQKKI